MNRKQLLVSIIILSYTPILLFQNYSTINSGNLFDPGFWGRFLGMIGVVTLMWQFLLGIKGLVSKFVQDLFWVNKVHKFLGMYVITLFFLHPVLILISYSMSGVQSVLKFSLDTEFDRLKVLGQIGFTILLVTWLASIFMRKRIGFRSWKRIHIFNYIVFPLAFVHSFGIGQDFVLPGPLNTYWMTIAVVFVAALIYRLVSQFGLIKDSFTLKKKELITAETNKLTFSKSGNVPFMKAGQFGYFKIKSELFGEWHPFTISAVGPAERTFSITPKSVGPFSKKMNNLKTGDSILFDGPYGIFTDSVHEHDNEIVLIAGGIGITPFLWIIELLSTDWDRKVTLFYGNRMEEDIAYRELIDSTAAKNPNFKVVHVLSNQSSYSGERGYITPELILKYHKNINDSWIYLSGPPLMVKSILHSVQGGLQPQKVEYELFEL